MWKKGSKLKYLDVFEITEEPEGFTNDVPHEDIVEKLELLKTEMLKLGKAQIQTRTFARSEYQALREAIGMISAKNDGVTDMVIEGLLPIADGLDAGIKTGNEMPDSEMDSWLGGLKIVHQRVMELLEKFDVHPLHSVGELFDPAIHTAVAVEHIQEIDDNIVLEEQRRGYIRDRKVIRYAEVIVNKRSHEHAIQVEQNGK